MQPAAFAIFHRPALERDEVKHNLLLAGMERLAGDTPPPLPLWTLGGPGACALQPTGYPIALGELTRAQCHALAEQTFGHDYPGVVGPDETAHWFAERAAALGVAFAEPIPQQIHALRHPPRYPGAAGQAREVTAADGPRFADWMIAFCREAVPHDPPPDRERLERSAADGRFHFWTIGGEPVSMAGIVRRTRHTGAIAGVYTPPDLRGRGYAGAATAAVAERLFAEGKTTVCLYTDLRNPFSNRCYAKIGFTPVCPSWLNLRTGSAPSQG